jgi:hypothetical protein
MAEINKANFIDNALRRLGKDIENAIRENEDGTDQKKQVERLMSAEKKFKNSIVKYKQGSEIYRKFIIHIVVKNKNILTARPYFREKTEVFSASITPAIENAKIKNLQKFNINYLFAKFIKDNWVGPFPEKSEKFFNQIVEARKVLIENNMPLAINRAKLFYGKVPPNHLTLTDVIGIAAVGLMSGIDKWVGEYRTVFRSVCIGRMTSNFIDEYSQTLIHFWPSDKHVLYRANSLAYKKQIEDFNALADAVNSSFDSDIVEGKKTQGKKVTADQLASLMRAASTLSANLTAAQKAEGAVPLEIYEREDLTSESNMEEDIEERDAMNHMFSSALGLPMIHQKVLRLKGVKI